MQNAYYPYTFSVLICAGFLAVILRIFAHLIFAQKNVRKSYKTRDILLFYRYFYENMNTVQIDLLILII